MSLTWLHISDFHVRGGDPYDRDVVLRALVESVAEYRAQGKPGRVSDAIFATGDIAFSGKAKEYEIAETFFDALLEAAQLKRDRLWVIPGNHDVDRGEGEGLARTLESSEKANRYFDPARPKPHLTQKMRAYLDWHNKYFEGIRRAPEDSTCGPVAMLEMRGTKLGILPINSALFCEDENDHGKLWVGRRCMDKAVGEVKALEADLNLVLMHHPLEWLHPVEAGSIQLDLERLGNVMLRGHLHVTRIENVVAGEGGLLRLAAGAAYDTGNSPMSAMYGTLKMTPKGGSVTIFPIRYEGVPRKWTLDTSAFPGGEEKTFEVRKTATAEVAPKPGAPVVEAGFRSNISARGNFPFVGREAVMEELNKVLNDPKHEGVVVLHGQAGAGKTAAAREFARQHGDRYPGGTFLIDASKDAIAINLAQIGKFYLDMELSAGLNLDEQGLQTFLALGKSQALLIYDNVQSFERIRPWLPLAGMRCHALVTTLQDTWNVTWPVVEVKPLSTKQSLELVNRLTGGELPKEVAEKIVKEAGGLPVQLVPSATTMANAKRRGLLKATATLALADEAKGSFGGAYGRLERAAKILLHAAATLTPERIPIAELRLHLTEALGWSETEVDRTLEMCFELHLLEGAPDPSMHQLFARYLREMGFADELDNELEKVRKAQAKRFVELAAAIVENPADVAKVSVLMSYPLSLQRWEALEEPLPGDDSATIGHALYTIGRFDDGRPWFERAVAEEETLQADRPVNHAKLGNLLTHLGHCLASTGRYAEAQGYLERSVVESEKGDLEGRVDHENLGRAMSQVGSCLSGLEKYDEARPWFERGVVESEKGDLHGRVDHDTIGGGLHLVGHCLFKTGKHGEAREWFERAVEESERGDGYGRVDSESVGRSLAYVADCWIKQRNYREALPWCERAVAEKERGDVHGRIDHQSLGGSLHQAGVCHLKADDTDQDEEALRLFKKAVIHKEKGDLFGRVGHRSVAVSMESIVECLVKMERAEEAQEWRERAKAEREKVG